MNCFKINLFNKYLVKISFNKLRQLKFFKEYYILKKYPDKRAYYNTRFPFIIAYKYLKGHTLNESEYFPYREGRDR